MRLSDVISKSSINEFTQIEGFLGNKRLKPHTHKNIAVGKVIRNFFCLECNDIRSFYSNDKLSCIIIANNLVSISCLLTCCSCGSPVPIWVLVECDNDIFSPYPQVRVLKRCEEFSNKASLNTGEYGIFSELLEKSQHAFNENLGAGSIVYLRKIYEQITIQMAETAAIDTKKANGKKKAFKDLLKEVDEKCSIIPKEFSDDGYKLFSDLSNVLHGRSEENLGLQKYKALRRLVCGIISNIKNKEELKSAIGSLGWNKNDK